MPIEEARTSKTEASGIDPLKRRKPMGSRPGTAHTPCVGTHVFIWSDPAVEKGPPEGLDCNCGMLELHYGTCPCGCGSRSMSLGFKRGEPTKLRRKKPAPKVSKV